MRQAPVLGLYDFPFARLRRDLRQLLDDPAQAVFFELGRAGHRLGVFARPERAAVRAEQIGHRAGLRGQSSQFVEQALLRRRSQQRLVRVLAVHVDQQLAHFTQLP